MSCSQYRHYVQNTEMLIYIMLKRRNVHTCSNFITWSSYTELGITAGQQKILINCVECLTTLVRYPVRFDLKFTALA